MLTATSQPQQWQQATSQQRRPHPRFYHRQPEHGHLKHTVATHMFCPRDTCNWNRARTYFRACRWNVWCKNMKPLLTCTWSAIFLHFMHLSLPRLWLWEETTAPPLAAPPNSILFQRQRKSKIVLIFKFNVIDDTEELPTQFINKMWFILYKIEKHFWKHSWGKSGKPLCTQYIHNTPKTQIQNLRKVAGAPNVQ